MTAARDRLVVLAPAALAAVLVLLDLSGRSLGFDEGASVTIAAQHGSALWHAIAHDGGNMSGYYLLLREVVAVFGNSEAAVRLPSGLAAIAAVWLIGRLGLRLFGPHAALVAGLLSAVSLPLVFWGQAARGYAFVVLLAAGSFSAFVSVVEGRSRRAWAAYVAYTALAVYASYTAVLIVAAQLAVLWWRRDAARRVALALLACCSCWIPLVVLALARGSGQLFWLPRPGYRSEKQVAELLTSSGLEPSFRAHWPAVVALIVTLLGLGLVAFFVVRSREWEPGLVLAWLLVPVGLAWLESLVGQPVFLPRNLIASMPAVALLLAWGLTRPQVPAALGWSLLAGLVALRAPGVARSYGVSPEDWRGATAAVLDAAAPGDCLAFYPSDGRMAFRYYAGSQAGRAPRAVLPRAPWSSVRVYVEDYATLTSAPAGCRRLWLVSSHEGQADGPSGSRANRARYLALRATLERTYGRHSVRQYGYAAPVRVELLGP